MPLHMTKIAFRASSVAALRQRIEGQEEASTSTRYLPKRHEEMAGGSLYWIVSHALVARTPILGFDQRDDGRWTIRLAPRLVLVESRPKRAHQGWRYLEDHDAPRDLTAEEMADEPLPGLLLAKLHRLGLV
ncbi:DUF1489 family protein [Altericroceibacterium xinjiangense]|uniref:DUF1489 family protein n=1 Tax=Altericroceibacterium xinjiangense TaxID=762261 RepID=UPI000F7F4B62|nr:DUF1489 family protein [Altericroceibacterium xinjiangense]